MSESGERPAIEPIRVLLADDDPLVRTGLSMVLGGSDEIDVIGEVEHGLAALELADDADLVLMDIRMPVMDGLTAIEELMKRDDPPRVIVLTTFDADEHVVRALAAGASGFLLKDTPPSQIVDAVRKVALGEPILSPSVTGQLIRHVTTVKCNADEQAAVDSLTDRERDVALAVARGASNAQIAAELFMSVATVKVHLGHVFAKLGVSNRVQVAIRMHDADSS